MDILFFRNSSLRNLTLVYEPHCLVELPSRKDIFDYICMIKNR